jgi:hypothetical protein
MLAHIVAGDVGQAGVEMLVGGAPGELGELGLERGASRASTRRG